MFLDYRVKPGNDGLLHVTRTNLVIAGLDPAIQSVAGSRPSVLWPSLPVAGI